MRRRVLIVVVTVLGVIASPLATRSDAANSRLLHVDATAVASTAPSTGAAVCDPAGHCLAPYTTDLGVSGEMTGALRNVGTLWLESTTVYQVTAIGLFVGEVAGCGAGTMALSFPLVTGGPVPFSGRLDIVGGSGTGGLAGISGSGAYRLTPTGEGSTSVVSLAVRCRAN